MVRVGVNILRERWKKIKNNFFYIERVKEFKSNRIDFVLTKENAGFYQCKIENSIGSIEKTIRVGYLGKLR